MNKADKYFIEIAEELMKKENSTENEKVRPRYADGVQAHTYFTTHKVFQYDLEKGEFPLLTLRPTGWKSAIKEILWIYQDQTSNLEVLRQKYGITWWDSWDIGDNTIGVRYGETVAKYDLINELIYGLKKEPYTRRHIMNLYQYHDFEETSGLYPCAFMTMWSVRNGKLDLSLIQRSSDFCVAWAINAISYVALQMMIAKTVGLEVGKFTHYIENVHIYDRHLEQVQEMLNRTPSDKTPKLVLNTDKTDFYSFTIDDFEVVDYEPVKPQLKFELGI